MVGMLDRGMRNGNIRFTERRLADCEMPIRERRITGSRTARGRAATRRAYEHLGLEPPREAALF